MAKVTKYVAFLRGINVGGKASVPMKQLSAVCEQLGWNSVTTYLRTGNVVFEASLNAAKLEQELERAVTAEFGWPIPVIVRGESLNSQAAFCQCVA